MQFSFRTKLMAIMGIFSIVLTISVTLVNQHRWEQHLTASYLRESLLVEDVVITAVSNADKALQILDKSIEMKMREFSDQLLAKYEKEPYVEFWNYQALKKKFEGMDIYIIDDTQTVLYSSYSGDIGLSFREKDGSRGVFAQLLQDRLNGNRFVVDGLDQESNSGKLKKYSYVPTPDHKYLLELGLDQGDNPIFRSFNFLEISSKLMKKYSYINNITVFTPSGKSIGKTGEDGRSILVSDENSAVFYKTFHEWTVQEVTGTLNGAPVTYRYVPYRVEFDTEEIKFTNQRIIEIVYNNDELYKQLRENNQVFILQTLATIACALLISYLISRLVARPIYLASHDVLTGLSNRAVFEKALHSSINKNKKTDGKTGLLHIDLDNFKQVNDTFGHDAGDVFLKEVSRRIRTAVPNPADITARLGGDEFVVILNQVTDVEAAEEIALHIIQELRQPIEINGVDVVRECNTTASIGIALAPDHAQDADDLYYCADRALYHAKHNGKNTCSVYHESLKKQTTAV
ncbi:GGDEF domain-containing protein [Paenibacillus sp. y28]|uniref:GGDEF domain-containing protein n=1 Tax=Paenibacillus sp. y28 TaxID=3129110 RepID=UPI0030196AA3